jgi:two-component system, OmpR family, sensor histidine kinase BaeS
VGRGVPGFWRGRQASKVSGGGVALAVAAELARAHGGELSASSTPEHGTRLTLTLPRADTRSGARG